MRIFYFIYMVLGSRPGPFGISVICAYPSTLDGNYLRYIIRNMWCPTRGSDGHPCSIRRVCRPQQINLEPVEQRRDRFLSAHGGGFG